MACGSSGKGWHARVLLGQLARPHERLVAGGQPLGPEDLVDRPGGQRLGLGRRVLLVQVVEPAGARPHVVRLLRVPLERPAGAGVPGQEDGRPPAPGGPVPAAGRRPVDALEGGFRAGLVDRGEQDQPPARVHGRLDRVEQAVQVVAGGPADKVGLVHDRQAGRVGPPARGWERQRRRPVGQAELVRVVPDDGGGLQRAGQAVVHAPQAEAEQVHRLVVALGEEQHRGGRAEQHEPQGESDGQPTHAELAGLEHHASWVGRQRLHRPHLAGPEAKAPPATRLARPPRRVIEIAAAVEEKGRRPRARQPERTRIEVIVHRRAPPAPAGRRRPPSRSRAEGARRPRRGAPPRPGPGRRR